MRFWIWFKRDLVNVESKASQKAHKMIWRLLSLLNVRKITHWRSPIGDLGRGVLWHMVKEWNDEASRICFLELFRYNSLHFEIGLGGMDYGKVLMARPR